MTRWFDTHCHLNHPDFQQEVTEVQKRAEEAGVQRLMVIGYDRESSDAALRLADGNRVVAAVGFHPSEAGRIGEEDLSWLSGILRQSGVRALGEIGIDLYWRQDNLSAQIWLFEQQLKLAEEYGLPVVIHQRAAAEEVRRVLQRHGVRGIFHCFQGDPSEVERALELPFAFAVGGSVTFPRNESLRDAITAIPRDRLLLETDAPYLAPVPHRGHRNEPAYLPIVGRRVAEVLGLPVEELAELTWLNACRLLGLPESVS